MKRLFPVLLLALLLFGSLQDRARAASTPPEKTASGSPGENPNKHATFNPVLTIQLQRDAAMWGEGTVLDVDIGPNLYAYVRQNPWTSWDPLGLETVDGYNKRIEQLEKRIDNYRPQKGGLGDPRKKWRQELGGLKSARDSMIETHRVILSMVNHFRAGIPHGRLPFR